VHRSRIAWFENRAPPQRIQPAVIGGQCRALLGP